MKELIYRILILLIALIMYIALIPFWIMYVIGTALSKPYHWLSLWVLIANQELRRLNNEK